MKVLGIDSSGLVASVAVVEDDILLAEYTVNYKKTHSQTLLPMLKEIGDMINLDLNSLDAIAIAAGPGSFTGLRIGSATAKGLGLALDKPIIPVPTVDGLAYDLWGTDKIVCPLMDARRNQHPFAGFYGFGQDPSLAVQLDMACRPCSVYGNKPCLYGTYACMSGIPPEAIVEKVCRRLGVEMPPECDVPDR